jgi:rhamnogalacturonyl hydrolase YesR
MVLIDTKGWAGWEWTHGVGLYGIYQYYQQTGDIEMREPSSPATADTPYIRSLQSDKPGSGTAPWC